MIMKFWVLSSSISSSPLVSSIVTLYALILLYVPHQFLRILFSPVLIITGILLFSILRLGATQKCREEEEEEEEEDDDENKKKSAEENQKTSTCQQADQNSNETNHSCEPEEEDHNWAVDHESETDSEPETYLSGKRSFEDSFFESWNLRAPLEVIYEEEEEEDRIERYASLSRYYPESEEEESDDYSDGEFPATGRFSDLPQSLGFQWEEEDREGLIEIALDGNKNNNNKRGLMDFHVEEDNLIEIDLSPARNDTPPASQVLST